MKHDGHIQRNLRLRPAYTMDMFGNAACTSLGNYSQLLGNIIEMSISGLYTSHFVMTRGFDSAKLIFYSR